jgi:hypothetical protein
MPGELAGAGGLAGPDVLDRLLGCSGPERGWSW